jgi:ATP-dependent Lon protease
MTTAKRCSLLAPGETRSVPVLPLRDVVAFPHLVVPLFVGRQKSIRALEEAVRLDTFVLLVTQKSAGDDDPAQEAIYEVGTLAGVLELVKMADGTLKVLVEGAQRARIFKYTECREYYEAEAIALGDIIGDRVEVEAFARSVTTEFETYSKLSKKVSKEVVGAVRQIEDYAKLADTVASRLAVNIVDKQLILETTAVIERLEKLLGLLDAEISVLQLDKRIRTRMKGEIEKNRRECLLLEYRMAIQTEMGGDEGHDDFAAVENKIRKTRLSKEAREKARRELRQLRRMSPMSAEAAVVRNYLDVLLSIPWNRRSKANKRLDRSQAILDSDHYGLEKVKERIIEHLAVQQRANTLTGPILCLVGPPGVGKTSLGKSIARATGREFVRISLAGVRDEADIRGHRRSYVASMPGRIIQSMRKVRTSNPLFLLDEIDKMGGDPASALLEVLDADHNHRFNDHYLEVDYDLSPVLFITTANTLDIPPPLIDRVEIIRIAGYSELEKVEIARKHLVPNAIARHGVGAGEWAIDDEALVLMIRRYTREAGVRNLERELSTLIRKAVKELMVTQKAAVQISADNLAGYLGVPKHRHGAVEQRDEIGLVTGLDWTEVGGELLTIEAVIMPGGGRMTVTGNLGELMKESISASASYVRSRTAAFGIEPSRFDMLDIHVHVPEGATPKDGPSMGVAMVTAIVSVMTGIPVRRDLAMIGEITLRGRVWPISGLKERLLAALRGGIRTVLIPEGNVKDLAEIADSTKRELEIIPVAGMDDVLARAMTGRSWGPHP